MTTFWTPKLFFAWDQPWLLAWACRQGLSWAPRGKNHRGFMSRLDGAQNIPCRDLRASIVCPNIPSSQSMPVYAWLASLHPAARWPGWTWPYPSSSWSGGEHLVGQKPLLGVGVHSLVLLEEERPKLLTTTSHFWKIFVHFIWYFKLPLHIQTLISRPICIGL